MRIAKLLLLGLLLLLPSFSRAQMADSLARNLPAVEITVAKPEQFAAGSRHTPIDSVYLRQNNAFSLAEVLQNATAVYVKSYGISTISFRGTGASQTAILWNGLNLNLPTLGQTDLSLLPVNSLGQVSLQHGSAGANFGSSAIGGAVLLQSSAAVKPGFHLCGQQDAGSFGRYYSRLGGSYGSEKFGLATSFFRQVAQNNFTYTNTLKFGRPVEKQENAATNQLGFTADLHWQPTTKSSFLLRNWFTASDNQVMPNMVAANTHGQNQNKNLRSMAEWNFRSRFGKTAVKVAFFHDFMRFHDDNVKPADTDIKTWQAQAEQTVALSKKLDLDFGTDVQLFTGHVDGYAKPVQERRNSVFALLRYTVMPALQLNLNWRQAFVPGFDPKPAPVLGFNYRLFRKDQTTVAWKGNFSKGYRVPTLNDRYWPPGNPNLQPENSSNFESGFQHQFSGRKIIFETELTGYTMQVKNWIQWAPGLNNGLWTAQNLKEVQASGLEFSAKFSYHFSPDFSLNANGNYAFTRSVQQAIYNNQEPALLHKQLIYVPLHNASWLLQTTFREYFLTLNGSFTGNRFADPENEKALPAFALLNLYGGRYFTVGKCRFQAMARVNNLTNTIYQNYQFYATPGRNYQFSLRFDLN